MKNKTLSSKRVLAIVNFTGLAEDSYVSLAENFSKKMRNGDKIRDLQIAFVSSHALENFEATLKLKTILRYNPTLYNRDWHRVPWRKDPTNFGYVMKELEERIEQYSKVVLVTHLEDISQILKVIGWYGFKNIPKLSKGSAIVFYKDLSELLPISVSTKKKSKKLEPQKALQD